MEIKIHCGTLVFRRSRGTAAQQLRNGCRVKLINFDNEKLQPGAKVLQRHGRYEHNKVVAALLADDMDARAKAQREKPKATEVKQ